MHQDAGLTVANAGRHAIIAEGGGEGHVAAGNGLAKAEDIRHHISVLQGEQLAAAAETGGDLIENQQHAMLVAQTAATFQEFRVVQPHTAGPLHHWLQNQRGDLVRVLLQLRAHGVQSAIVPDAVEPHRGRLGEVMPRQNAAEQIVHAVDRIAHRHGPEGVAMIAVAQRQQPVFAGLALAHPVLQRHLDRHFHRHRTAVRQEYLGQFGGRQRHQPLAQFHRRLVSDAAEHHVGHAFGLVTQGLIQTRVVIAVDRRPPGRHAVHQPAPVFQLQVDAFGGAYRVHRQGPGGGGVRMPEMVAVEIEVDGGHGTTYLRGRLFTGTAVYRESPSTMPRPAPMLKRRRPPASNPGFPDPAARCASGRRCPAPGSDSRRPG